MSVEIVYDLCIVGAGMFGSAAARHASTVAGMNVCLIGPDEPTPEEKRSRDIFGAHYDEGRLTYTLSSTISRQILSRCSIKRYRELEELSGIHFYDPVGCMFIEKENAGVLTDLKNKNLNFPYVDLIQENIFEIRYPFLKLELGDQALLDDIGAGHISPRKMVAAEKKVAITQGCFFLNDVVDEVGPLVNNTHKIITRKGQVLISKRILFCTGAFTNFMKFPIPKLKFQVNKETVVYFKLPVEEAERLSSMPGIIYYRTGTGAYILPPIMYPDGHFYLKLGHLEKHTDVRDEVHTLSEVKEWYLSDGDDKKIEFLSKLLKDLIPGLKYVHMTSGTCVTSSNPSGEVYIDRVTPTITVAVIGNGYGAKMSDEVGRIAAHLSLTGEWDSKSNQSNFKIMVDSEYELSARDVSNV